MFMSGAAQRFEENAFSDDTDYFDGGGLLAGEADFCSRSGAQALKGMIEAYWRARGHDVQIALHNVGFHPAIRAARYDVRSDMVNGMPRGAGKGQRVAGAPVDAFDEEFASE